MCFDLLIKVVRSVKDAKEWRFYKKTWWSVCAALSLMVISSKRLEGEKVDDRCGKKVRARIEDSVFKYLRLNG